ncbi:MAG: hypothetical protein K8R46_03670 [Pirellulales bacterium]|nr:hypothetical protein [Pirellulales bacterium]
MKRILLFGLLGGLLTVGSGCGLMQAVFCYRPCVTQGDCAPGYGYYNGKCGEDCGGICDPSCGPRWGPARAPAFAPRRALVSDECGRPCRGPYCHSCAPVRGDPCGERCYDRCWHRGPLSCLFALFTYGSWYGPTCGERYWGDFYSDPPDCWDPCDCYGNNTGGSCHDCGEYGDAAGYSRYSRGYADDGVPVAKKNIISQTDRAVASSPKPASRPHKVVRR